MKLLPVALRLLIVLGGLSLTACSAPVLQLDDWQDPALGRVWPEPPQSPRVRLLRVIGDQSDLQKEGEGHFFDWLFGESAGQLPLISPYGIAADGKGRVWVADPGGAVVHIFDLARKTVEYIGQVGDVRLVSPVGLTYNPRLERFYVSDGALKRVFILDPEGSPVGELEHPDGFERPAGLAIGPGGDVYVADVPTGKVIQFSAAGEYVRTILSATGDSDLFNHPTNVAVDTAGRLYVTDSMRFRIVVQTSDGDLVEVIGGAGDKPGRLARPRGVATDSEGHIYIVDAAFDNVQIFDLAGRLLLYLGEPGKGGGEFCLPAGIFIDQGDRIYLSESCNGRFQIFQYLSEMN